MKEVRECLPRYCGSVYEKTGQNLSKILFVRNNQNLFEDILKTLSAETFCF